MSGALDRSSLRERHPVSPIHLCDIVRAWWSENVPWVVSSWERQCYANFCRIDATVAMATTPILYIYTEYVSVEHSSARYEDVYATDPNFFAAISKVINDRVFTLAERMAELNRKRLYEPRR